MALKLKKIVNSFSKFLQAILTIRGKGLFFKNNIFLKKNFFFSLISERLSRNLYFVIFY